MKPWQAASMRAVLPQATALSFPFTVREIVRLGLIGGRSGALPGEDERLPDRALARVDLDGFAGRFYQELSGGEQQRVQLARVLCQVWAPVLDGRPRYLFLDEPVSSLDIKHQLMIMNIARDFAKRGGGVVAILHDLNLTAMYADRVHRHASRPACRRRHPAGCAQRRDDREGVRVPAEGRCAACERHAVRAAAIGGVLAAGVAPSRHSIENSRDDGTTWPFARLCAYGPFYPRSGCHRGSGKRLSSSPRLHPLTAARPPTAEFGGVCREYRGVQGITQGPA